MKTKLRNIIICFFALIVGYFMGINHGKMIPYKGANTEDFQYTMEKAEYLKEFINKEFLFETSDEKMNEGMLKGLFLSLEDPYSAYMNEDEFKSLMESNAGAFGGIGVTVSPSEDGFITVIAPIKGTPADREGIRAGDKIIKIEGKEYYGSDMDEAVKIMRGEPGESINITILRTKIDKSTEEIDLSITREVINVISAEGEILNENLGYIHISSFDENTDKYFEEVREELETKGAKGLIIDLRNNPGGLLDSVINIADQILPEGPIVVTKTKDGKEITESSSKNLDDIPLVVLINGGSASASEILAGAIQDYDRGLVIGETSFGKGIVQRIIPLEDDTGVKLTVSEYYTPNERKIHEIGVVPDIEIEATEDFFSFGPEVLSEDMQLQRAIEELESIIK